MDTYRYAVIRQLLGAIELKCTDPSFVDQLLASLAGSLKKFKVSGWKLPSGEPYRWQLYGTSEEQETIWWWIVQRFCRHGWEPLENPSSSKGDPAWGLSFRFREKEQDAEQSLHPWYSGWSTADGEASAETAGDYTLAPAQEN